MQLTNKQQEAVMAGATSFLLGPAGTGKTAVLQHRLLRLLREGELAYTILVLVAELEQQQAFYDAIHQSDLGAYADLKVTTYNAMAQEMVTLFWPLVARPAGFARPFQPPIILSYDLAQLLMWHTITPMLNEGSFSDLRLRPQQIVSQLLDTLNRAALNGLSLDEAISRQQTAWAGEPKHIRHLAEAAEAARRFRATCLEHSLLDLSLVVEVFDTQLVRHPEFQKYFSERFRHLIIDNVEEQTPAGQNFITHLMDVTATTALAYDAGGGYKRFLAADPTGARLFYGRSRLTFTFDQNDSFIAAPAMAALANRVENFLLHTNKETAVSDAAIVGVINGRYRRDMVTNLAAHLRTLLDQGLHPSDIAIIVPYLDGALRYMISRAFSEANIPYFLLRRRSSPREEPRIRAWLTWLALAHPDWGVTPAAYDVAEALTLSIHGLDPARAELLTERLYQPDTATLLPAETLPETLVTRIGFDMVGLFEDLRRWLAGQDGSQPIDAFLHTLFTQLLSQKRFQPEPDLAGAAVCDWLVKAATRLRQSARSLGLNTPAAIGRVFIEGIHNGLVTANPPDLGEPPDPNGVMISTIYGYLLAGRPVQLQVWLETAATGWWDIPNQPLSNAFVLAQSYDAIKPWTMDEDFLIRNELLSRIVRGLTNRCRGGILLATSELDRRGVRQEGMLWRALQPVKIS